jgi:hypothetical protein
MIELEERIICFVAEQTGIKARRILLSSSLAQEIGMDGDDAVEFFQSFGRDFNVDLGRVVATLESAFWTGSWWAVSWNVGPHRASRDVG